MENHLIYKIPTLMDVVANVKPPNKPHPERTVGGGPKSVGRWDNNDDVL
jgi:hypothetical protein